MRVEKECEKRRSASTEGVREVKESREGVQEGKECE